MRVTIVILSLFISIALSAQDVSGVQMDSLMTRAQVIEKFGEPISYKCNYSYLDEDVKYELYYYGENDRLVFVDEKLYGFDVSTTRWTVLHSLVKGGVNIGDPLSKVSSLNLKMVDWLKTSDTYYVPCGEYPILINVGADSTIIKISYNYLH